MRVKLMNNSVYINHRDIKLVTTNERRNFYKDIANDVERWFDTSNYDKNDKRPLPIGINKRVIGMYKEELGGKIMVELCGPK